MSEQSHVERDSESSHVERDREYQDVWVRGKVITKGSRECELRYQILKDMIEYLISPQFKMIDFGAAAGYFTVRVASDFPESECIAIDRPKRYLLDKVIRMNNLPNVSTIQKLFAPEDIDQLKDLQPDLTLAMSIVHHFPDPLDVIDRLCSLAPYTFIECYPPDSHVTMGTKDLSHIYLYVVDKGGIRLKHSDSKGRPLFLISRADISLPSHLLYQ